MSRCIRIAVLTIGLLCAFGFVVLLALVSLGLTDVLDAQLSVAVRELRNPALNELMVLVTQAGSWWFVGVGTALTVMAMAHKGRWRDVIASVLIVVGGVVLSGVLKALIGRVRPPAESALMPLPLSEAFPSGHAIASACLAAVLLLALSRASGVRRTLGFVMVPTYPALVGFSRVYLGVHWPTDVAAAALLGGAWAALVVWVSATWRAGAAA